MNVDCAYSTRVWGGGGWGPMVCVYIMCSIIFYIPMTLRKVKVIIEGQALGVPFLQHKPQLWQNGLNLTSIRYPVSIGPWGPYVFLRGQADLPISGLRSFLSWATSGSPDGPAQIRIAQTRSRSKVTD